MLKAMELDQSGELDVWLNNKNVDSLKKVEAVKRIYTSLKVDQLAFQLMDEYYQKAISSLHKINASEELKIPILEFSEALMKRSS